MTRDLHIECIAAEASVVVTVAGEIDLVTAPQLERRLREAERLVGPSGSLVVDLRAVRFLSARGLTVLLCAYYDRRERGARFCIVATHRAVLRPVGLAGLANTLCVVPTLPGWLHSGLSDRAVIAQARGIVMASRHLDADEARAALVEQARREGVLLRDLADRVVDGLPRQVQRTRPLSVGPILSGTTG